jgi:hypothetical protein
VLGDWVRIDQSQGDCSREHECRADQVCPIEGQFLACYEANEIVPLSRSRLIDRLVGRL